MATEHDVDVQSLDIGRLMRDEDAQEAHEQLARHTEARGRSAIGVEVGRRCHDTVVPHDRVSMSVTNTRPSHL